MKSMGLTAVVACTMATGSFGLSLAHVQQHSSLQSQGLESVLAGAGLDRASYISDRGYQTVVKLRDDGTMGEFVKRLLAIEGKYVPQDQEGELSGFVQWFSGTKATQSYRQMRLELARKSWVKDLKAVDGASLSEMDYQAIASLRDDTAMSLLANALLTSVNKSVPREEQDELAGFIPWFSGTKAVQSLQQMRIELLQKPWVHATKAVGASGKEAHAATQDSSKQTAAARIEKKNQTKVVGASGKETKAATGNSSNQATAARIEKKNQTKVVGAGGKETQAATGNSNNQTAAARTAKKNQTKIQFAEHSVESEPAETKLTEAFSRDADVPRSDVAGAAQCSECIVWGEANILSFSANRIRVNTHPDRAVEFHVRKEKHDQFIVSEAGTYWLVNNKDVQIQGRYWQYNRTRRGLGLGAIAVGGPMVGNSTLVIRALGGPVTWNGQEILHKHPSKFSHPFVKADYVADVGPVAGDTHAPGIKFIFSSGVNLSVARYRNKLSARISVCESDSGAAAAESQCGTLKRTPRSKANAFFAAQRRAVKLPVSEIIFPDGAVNSRRKRH